MKERNGCLKTTSFTVLESYRINNVSEEYPAWVIRFWDDRFGVAVPYSGVIINENFESTNGEERK